MSGYYARKLSSHRLRRVYEIAPPAVQRYLQAEIDYLLDRIHSSHLVLELGCGYGRILVQLAGKTSRTIGIDTSLESLNMAVDWVGPAFKGRLMTMNAACLGFRDGCFDVVGCLQNGISAFKVDRAGLLEEALRVTKPGGTVLFSSYADHFWPHRLDWFRLQADEGLIGEIDEKATNDGVIVCRDGFRADTIGPDGFRTLTSKAGLNPNIEVLEEGGVMCEIRVP